MFPEFQNGTRWSIRLGMMNCSNLNAPNPVVLSGIQSGKKNCVAKNQIREINVFALYQMRKPSPLHR